MDAAAHALPIAVTMGDPAGVGPLITCHAWRMLRTGSSPFYLIASAAALDSVRDNLPPTLGWTRIGSPAEAAAAFSHALPVLVIEGGKVQPGAPTPAHAPAIIRSIELAAEHVRSGRAAAMTTNPISKSVLTAAGFPHPGHTEFLAELDQPNRDGMSSGPVMMLAGGGLKVALATIHTPLRDVPGRLTVETIVSTTRTLNRALKRDFGYVAPRIGLAGLNPHAGEAGTIGREEMEIINPAAARLRAEGVDASDARPGDIVFHEAREGGFDAVVAMYHDQGLIPVKTLDLWGGVNVTLGLSFIRTSPDHGTAFDAALAGNARADSLIAALSFAARMARHRTRVG
ncbi:4-hydroxythreonine-4-phosphate dehydrogenase PdxA [bacterium]|nr:4-hydroxythreonine-4-phosphate dehydrogenase PdxA [bacterium]